MKDMEKKVQNWLDNAKMFNVECPVNVNDVKGLKGWEKLEALKKIIKTLTALEERINFNPELFEIIGILRRKSYWFEAALINPEHYELI